MLCQAYNCYSLATDSFIYSKSNHPEFSVSVDRSLFLCKKCQNSSDQAKIWVKSLVNYNGTSIDIPSCWIPLVEKFSEKPKVPILLFRGLSQRNFEIPEGEVIFEKISYWTPLKEVAQNFARQNGIVYSMKIQNSDCILLDTCNWEEAERKEEQNILLKPGKYFVKKSF